MSNENTTGSAVTAFLDSVLGPDGTPLAASGRILDSKYACGRVRVDVLSRGLDIPVKRQIDTALHDGLMALEGVTEVIVNMVNPDTATDAPAASGPTGHSTWGSCATRAGTAVGHGAESTR